MRNKIFVFIVSALMLVLFVTSPVIALLSNMGYLDALYTKNLFVTESYADDDTFLAPVVNKFEDFKTTMKNIYVNCLPYYSEIITEMQIGKNALTLRADALLRPLFTGTSEAPVTPDDDSQSIYDTYNYVAVHLAGNGRPSYYSIQPINTVELVETSQPDVLEQAAITQASYLKAYAEKYPDVNFYVYIGSSFQNYENFSDITGGQAQSNLSNIQAYKSIITEGMDNVWCDWLPINSVADRMNYLFKSDHHWNAYGAYAGYQSIISAVHEKTPEISEPREFDILKVDGIRWIGLVGGSTNLYYDEYADDFWVFDLSWMQNYESEYSKANNYDVWKMSQDWLNGKYPENYLTNYFDYYGEIFRHETKVTFHDNQTGRNLLIFGDSFSKPLQLPLASHFDNTYVVSAANTNIGAIMKENNITDVIVVMYTPRLVYGFDGSYFGDFMNY